MSKIYTKVTSLSWSKIPKEKASEYLDYYPKNTKEHIFKFAKENRYECLVDPKILDICCGNGVNYRITKDHFQNFKYEGIDCSPNLIEEARKRAEGDSRAHFSIEDCYEFFDQNKSKFDLTIIYHVIECTESPDFLVGKSLAVSKFVAIGWFDPPEDRFDTVEIMPSTFPEMVENAPYIRRKISTDYWQMILKKHNAEIVDSFGTGKNRVDIIRRR